MDVTSWEVIGDEPMGEPGKRWLEEPLTRAKWLFKPVRTQNDSRGAFPQGDDWAEKIAADLAASIGLPAARVELARRGRVVGAISCDIADGCRLSLGNEIMATLDPDYPAGKVGTVGEYTLDRIFDVLVATQVLPAPVSGVLEQSARSLFAGYLLLDAWVANQDRHHGNWGILEDLVEGSPPRLAPSFDHGSSLGFQLHDSAKSALLDRGDVFEWAKRGLCRPMAGKPNLVLLARMALKQAGSAASYWLHQLASVTSAVETSIVDAIPGGRMSQPSRSLAKAVLETNRRRLLDGI